MKQENHQQHPPQFNRPKPDGLWPGMGTQLVSAPHKRRWLRIEVSMLAGPELTRAQQRTDRMMRSNGGGVEIHALAPGFHDLSVSHGRSGRATSGGAREHGPGLESVYGSRRGDDRAYYVERQRASSGRPEGRPAKTSPEETLVALLEIASLQELRGVVKLGRHRRGQPHWEHLYDQLGEALLWLSATRVAELLILPTKTVENIARTARKEQRMAVATPTTTERIEALQAQFAEVCHGIAATCAALAARYPDDPRVQAAVAPWLEGAEKAKEAA
jgi:hypothetical protein